MDSQATLEEEVRAYSAKQRRGRGIIAILLVALAICIVTAASLGSSSVDIGVVLRTIASCFGGEKVSDVQRSIVMDVRLPRIFCGVFVGASLSMAGLIMQGIFRNPLVSPYTLGVSSGAACGASIAIIMSSDLAFLGLGKYLTPVFAFVFSVATMALVYGISKVTSGDTKTLILSGVAIGYLFSAIVAAIKYLANVQALPDLVFWSMGSLSGLKWDVVAILLVAFVLCFVITFANSWNFNVMALGPEEAKALGVDYHAMLIMSFLLTTLLTAAAVSFAGVIGFVGLIAPHVTRMVIGSNDYRYCVPASALMGALLLLVSDTVARTMFMPTEIPIGIITSVLGVPFFLYLVIRKRSI